ncbi:MAG: hypothetical protein V4726_23285 [Verrucomicrobiota bacterium]
MVIDQERGRRFIRRILPDDAVRARPREALLEHQVASLTGEMEQPKEVVERLNQERTVLRLKIHALFRRLFGNHLKGWIRPGFSWFRHKKCGDSGKP